MKKQRIYSYSAPNLISLSKEIIQMTFGSISPGVSPSAYKILNFALDSPYSPMKNIFFHSENSNPNYDSFKNLSPIDEKHTIDLTESQRKSKSASNLKKNLYIYPIIEENFEESIKKFELEEILTRKSDENLNKKCIIVSVNNVILQKPPKLNRKRAERGTFVGEKITIHKFTGILKNFNLRKRFGFIKVEEANKKFEVFVCEDDLILSGVNYKQFKENVFKKNKIFLRFNIKKHVNEGKEIQKAVEIEII